MFTDDILINFKICANPEPERSEYEFVDIEIRF